MTRIPTERGATRATGSVGLPPAVAIVTLRCAPLPGQEFGDVHVVRRVADTRDAALEAATEAAAKLAHDRSPGAPFQVSATHHR